MWGRTAAGTSTTEAGSLGARGEGRGCDARGASIKAIAAQSAITAAANERLDMPTSYPHLMAAAPDKRLQLAKLFHM